MLQVNLFYLAILAFTAILWFIPVIALLTFLIGGINALTFKVPQFHLQQALTKTYWWPYLGLNVALALLGAWWSLCWW